MPAWSGTPQARSRPPQQKNKESPRSDPRDLWRGFFCSPGLVTSCIYCVACGLLSLLLLLWLPVLLVQLVTDCKQLTRTGPQIIGRRSHRPAGDGLCVLVSIDGRPCPCPAAYNPPPGCCYYRLASIKSMRDPTPGGSGKTGGSLSYLYIYMRHIHAGT